MATDNVIDFMVKRASVDPKELIRKSEEDAMMRARKRAEDSGLIAYPSSFAQGWFAVPSQSSLGHVHLGAINWTTGQPMFCSCESYVKWCIHAGAMRLVWEREREIDDHLYRQMREEGDRDDERAD